MKGFFTISILLLLCSILVLDADAQWPRKKGKGYAQVSLGRAAADKGFDASRKSGPLGSFNNPEDYTEFAVYAYMEYGLSDQATLVASTYGKRIRVVDDLGSHYTTGLSDLIVQIRYTILEKGPLVISPHIGFKTPMGYDSGSAPPLGSGSADLLANAALGYSLHPAPAYLGMSFGLQFRGGSIQNEYYGHVEGGVYVNPKFLLRGRLDLVESTKNSISTFSTMDQIVEQGAVMVGPGLSALFSPEWQLHADARWTVAGRTTSQLFSVIVGLAYVW